MNYGDLRQSHTCRSSASLRLARYCLLPVVAPIAIAKVLRKVLEHSCSVHSWSQPSKKLSISTPRIKGARRTDSFAVLPISISLEASSNWRFPDRDTKKVSRSTVVIDFFKKWERSGSDNVSGGTGNFSQTEQTVPITQSQRLNEHGPGFTPFIIQLFR